MQDRVIRAVCQDGRNRTLSLPQLLAEMACGHVVSYPALRPHQRAAWHMLLVQLACAALRRAESERLPRDEGSWRSLLRSLTSGYPQDEPWRLVPPNREAPGFMQPPDPGGLKWEPVLTADALDILVTARNHDLKSGVALEGQPEDWIFSLVSLQTMSGHAGRNNYGIVRMNGGASSRPLVGLAPASAGVLAVDASAWWARDVLRLLEDRRSNPARGPGKEGGPVLLWLQGWVEMEQIRLQDLDPWFIEVCRRIRLDADASGRLFAHRSTSRKARTDSHVEGKATNGVVGDPWTPVNIREGKSLTLSPGDFDWRRICALLFSGEWELPLLARRGPGESGDMVLVAENLNRGQGKTHGFRSRVIPVPAGAARAWGTAGGVAARQVEEVDLVVRILRHAIGVFASGGNPEAVDRRHLGHAFGPVRNFTAAVDRIFFHHLWERQEEETATDTANGAESSGGAARTAFLVRLRSLALSEFTRACPSVPCPAFARDKARVRALNLLRGRLHRQFPEIGRRSAGQQEDSVNA